MAMVMVRRTYNEETEDYERESVKSWSDKPPTSCIVEHEEHTKDGGGKATIVPETQLGFVMIGTVRSMTPMISLALPANQANQSTHACLRLEQSSSGHDSSSGYDSHLRHGLECIVYISHVDVDAVTAQAALDDSENEELVAYEAATRASFYRTFVDVDIEVTVVERRVSLLPRAPRRLSPGLPSMQW